MVQFFYDMSVATSKCVCNLNCKKLVIENKSYVIYYVRFEQNRRVMNIVINRFKH